MENNIFETGRHKELNEQKFNEIIKDIEDFAIYARHNETAYYRLCNILRCAKIELKILETE